MPDPEIDWHAGRIGPTNTDREQAFIDEILRICEEDKIDTIFPSNDPWNYVFAKNRELFEQRGIVVPVPDYPTVITPLDKYRTVELARKLGFPTPVSCLYEDVDDVSQLVDRTNSPWMVRPRFTTGSRGMEMVSDAAKLGPTADRIAAEYGTPMIQEYIPGSDIQNFYIVIDRNGKPVSVFTPKVLRTYGRILRTASGASITQENPPYSNEAVSLLREIGWWGGATVQTKRDPRDGLPKLMEINPRLGQYLWTRTELGINEPELCLRIARGESPPPVIPGSDYPLGTLLLEPTADIANFFAGLIDFYVFKFRETILGRPSADPASAPRGPIERLRAYGREYCGSRDRVYHPSFRYLLEDPRPCLLWASKKFESATRLLRISLVNH